MSFRTLLISTLLVFATASSLGSQEPKLKPEELLARHLAQFGPQPARDSAATRVAEGTGQLNILRGGSGGAVGPARLLAEGRKLALRIQFDDPQYPLEEFAFDGQRTYAGRYLHTVRSRLADFLERYNQILHEGLLGGVLSESWPPLALSERQPKLKYLGVKKVDDQSLLALDYKARGTGGLKITLYFDPGTYRHVLTTYSATVRIAMRSSREDNMAIHDAADRYTLQERFSDFLAVNGLDLPTRWNLRLIIDRATGVGFGDATSEWVWDITLDNIRHDQPIDPQAFVLE